MKIGKMTNKYEIIFISPHIDDAILSCGGLIAKFSKEKKKILIVTVFTEGINKKRKNEDNELCKLLNVDYIHLRLTDVVKRKNELSWEKIKDKLIKRIEIQKNEVLYFPLGIGEHIDHLLVRKVGESFKKNKVYFWEDYPYKMYNSVQIELLKLREHFLLNKVENIEDFLDTKRRLIGVYKSQTKVIFGSKPIFLSSFEKYYIKKDGDLNDGILYLTDELEGGAKIANDYILEKITKQTNLEKFEFLEQVYRRDNDKLSGTKRWFWSVWSYRLLLKELNYLKLTVLTTSPNALMAAWWLKKRGFIKNIKLIFYSNGDRSYFSRSLLINKGWLGLIYYWCYCMWYRLMEKISFRTIDKVLVPSEFYKYKLLDKFGLADDKKVIVLEHGVDKNLFYPKEKKERRNNRIIGYIGIIDPQKGVWELAKAIKGLKSSKYCLWLITPNVNENKYLELIKKIGLGTKIKILFPKNRYDLAEIYRKIDLVVLASEVESGPLVMYEALASGCGFIGSKTGNMVNILSKIDKRFLLNNLGPQEITKKIKWYFGLSKKNVKIMREKGISVMKKHNWDKVVDEILIIMRKI